ncbi:hypothetical protein Hanom_Chr04g00309541 [Helianthus anomalus]
MGVISSSTHGTSRLTTMPWRCPLAQKLTSSVLNVLKSCTLCPLGQTQLDFFVKYDYTRVF